MLIQDTNFIVQIKHNIISPYLKCLSMIRNLCVNNGKLAIVKHLLTHWQDQYNCGNYNSNPIVQKPSVSNKNTIGLYTFTNQYILQK